MADWRTTQRQIVILLPVYINTLLTSGCSDGWLSNAVYFLQQEGSEISATQTQCTWISSVAEVGRFLFAIPSGLLVDKYGRKKLFIGVSLLNFLPWITLAFSKSLMTIYIARFFMGINNSLLNASSFITIGEIATPEIRGKLIVLRQIVVSIGVLIPCIISIIFPSYTALNYGISAISVLCLVSICWISETPHHLIRSSKYDQAKWNLIHARPGCHEHQINREFEKLKEYIDTEKKLKRETNWLQFIRAKSIKNPLLTATLLVFFQSLIGTHVVSAYITLIIPNNSHIPKKFYPLINAVITLLSRSCTAFYIDRFPRRTLFISVGLLICVTQLFNGLNYYLFHMQNWQPCFLNFVFGNVLVRILISGCLIPLTNTVKSEIFPQMVKGFGGSLCVLFTSFGDLLGYVIFEIVFQFGLHYLYTFYAASSIVLVFVVFYRLPEGRAKGLVEIQNVLNAKG